MVPDIPITSGNPSLSLRHVTDGFHGEVHDRGKDHHQSGDKHHRNLGVVPHMEKLMDDHKCELGVHSSHHGQDVPLHRHDARRGIQNYGYLYDGRQNRLDVNHGLVELGVYI